MAKRIIVNVIPEEIRMALCEDGRLLEVAIERTQSDSLVGNIYKGRVENVLPGMQAAFINIGNGKNAFLYAGDIFPRKSFQRLVAEDNLTVGAEIMIEIVKDAMGTKGPRATTHFSIPGRYVVVMPSVDYVGVSRRIESAEERSRLRSLAEKIRPKGMGVIVRTVAEGRSEEELARDFQYLANLWSALTVKAKRAKAPFLLYRDADLVIRIIRDHVKDDIDEVIIDNADAYARMVELAKFISPDLVKKIHLYKAKTDLFTHYAIDDEWNRLADRRVDLKCGGYLIIDRTEALTVIDVNTGRFTGHSNLADTVFRTNMEAAAEIARQLRLRDIGGIIVADFIDMQKEGHKKAILTELEARLKADNTKTNVLGLTELGLVEMTRKKSRQTYESTLYESCPCCGGRGSIQTPATLAISVRRQLRRISQKHPGASLCVQLHPRVADEFGDAKAVQAFAAELGMELSVEPVAALQAEVFVILEGEKMLVRSNAPKKVRKPYLRPDAEGGEAPAGDMEPLSEEELAPLLAEQFAMMAVAEPESTLESRLAAMADSLWEPLLEPDDDELADLLAPILTEPAAETAAAAPKPRRRRKSKKMLPPSVTDRLAAEAAAAEAAESVESPVATAQVEPETAPEAAPKKSRRRRKPKAAAADASVETAEVTETVQPELVEPSAESAVASSALTELAVDTEPAKPKRKRRRKKKPSPAEPVAGEASATEFDAEPAEPAEEAAEEMPAVESEDAEAAVKKTKRRRRKKKKPVSEQPAESGVADTAAVESATPAEPDKSAEATSVAETAEAAVKKTKRRRRKKKPADVENGDVAEPAAEPDNPAAEPAITSASEPADDEPTAEATAAVKKKRRRRRSNGKKKPTEGEAALPTEPESPGEPD
jgi:ribonuclease G